MNSVGLLMGNIIRTGHLLARDGETVMDNSNALVVDPLLLVLFSNRDNG
jgi:hypothetical protein